LHWLAWLAQRLREKAQTDFMMEKLQPAWLPTPAQKWIFRIAVMLLVAIFQLLIDIPLGLLPRGRLLLAFEEKLQESVGAIGLSTNYYESISPRWSQSGC
jgi:hypothetical protein